MKPRFAALASLIAAFTLTACGSAQEEARKKPLEALADQLEPQAEAAAKAQKKQSDADVAATKTNNTSSGNKPRRSATTNHLPSW
jgi:predicted small lipoprotein YifL